MDREYLSDLALSLTLKINNDTKQALDVTFLSAYVNASQTQKKPQVSLLEVSSHSDLAVSYSHMGKPHTTIGVTAFHF